MKFGWRWASTSTSQLSKWAGAYMVEKWHDTKLNGLGRYYLFETSRNFLIHGCRIFFIVLFCIHKLYFACKATKSPMKIPFRLDFFLMEERHYNYLHVIEQKKGVQL